MPGALWCGVDQTAGATGVSGTFLPFTNMPLVPRCRATDLTFFANMCGSKHVRHVVCTVHDSCGRGTLKPVRFAER